MPRPTIRQASGVEAGGGLYFTGGEKKNYTFFSTGCTLLDCVIGGGWCLSRVDNIVGDKSSGKTLLAMEAVANFFMTFSNGWADYVEAESAWDPEYARALGIPVDKLGFKDDIDTIEGLFKFILEKITTNAKRRPGLIIVDSLDALSDAAEMEREVDKGTYGAAKAKQMSQMFRRIVRQLARANIALIIVSQVRENMNAGAFAEKYTRSGGKALDFYASRILWLGYKGSIKKTVRGVTRPIGVEVRARCKKNKVGLPMRECDFNIRFGFGVQDKEASETFLKLVNRPVPTDPTALREATIREWYDIEKKLLPEKGKYA